jgi:hypothetical protein
MQPEQMLTTYITAWLFLTLTSPLIGHLVVVTLGYERFKVPVGIMGALYGWVFAPLLFGVALALYYYALFRGEVFESATVLFAVCCFIAPVLVLAGWLLLRTPTELQVTLFRAILRRRKQA